MAECTYLENRLETDDSSCPLLLGKITPTASPTVCGEGQCVTIPNGLREDDITQCLMGREFFFTSSLKLRRWRGFRTPSSGLQEHGGRTCPLWLTRHRRVLSKHHGAVVGTRDMVPGLKEQTG